MTRQDIISDEVQVVSVFDPFVERWTTTVIGGPLDMWSTTYRAEEAGGKHEKAIELAKQAAERTSC